MGKTRDFFKKIRNSKGTFHAKMGTIKDRNGMDLTEAEEKVFLTVKLMQQHLPTTLSCDGAGWCKALGMAPNKRYSITILR